MKGRDTISKEEFRTRVESIASEVSHRGLGGLLAWSRGGATLDGLADVLWLTNYYNPWLAVPDSERWTGQSYAAALVTADAECVLVTNVPSEEWRSSHVACDAFTDEPFIHLGAARVITERGLATGRIGLSGRTVLSTQLFELLREALPATSFEAADDIVRNARRIKSPAEQDIIRETGRVADATMSAMLAASTPGASERDVAQAAIAATVRAGGVPYSLALATGPDADLYCPSTLPSWSDRILRAGELWHVDLAGSYGGYIFDFARTTVIGEDPDREQRETIDAAIAVVESVIELIEPGRTIGEAVAQGHRVQAEMAPFSPAPGKHDYPHVGHTIGIGFEDVWLYESERRPFEAGMYIAVESAIARPGVGVASFEQNLLLTGNGVELTTVTPIRPWEGR